MCKKIKQDEHVIWCNINGMTIGQSATAPNDPIYLNGLQWNLRNESPAGIDAASAWQITPGSASTVIAILDGGIIPHADIAASRLLPGYNFVTNASTSSDGGGRDADPTDYGDWSVVNGCPTSSSWHAPRVTIVVVSLETKNMGTAMKEISGTLRTIIQGQGISSAVAA